MFQDLALKLPQFKRKQNGCHTSIRRSPYLQAGMASEFQKSFHDTDVSLVDGDVEGGLSTLVASVQIRARVRQQFHHARFIAKCRVMRRAVSIFVLRQNKVTINCWLRN